MSFFKWETKKGNYQIKHNVCKRIFDILFSLTVLILGFPIFFVLSLVVLFSSHGSMLYGHYRVGRGNKTIKCWKFRTMVKDADQKLHQLLNNNSSLQLEWNKFYKLKNDPRVTSIGSFLRKTSLDELPQFFNVLKGDLSIVGPRPCIPKEIIQNFGEKTNQILSIRPGITGIWQISGRNNLTRKERVTIEEEYIEKQSLLTDIKIILKTIIVMFSWRGAY